MKSGYLSRIDILRYHTHLWDHDSTGHHDSETLSQLPYVEQGMPLTLVWTTKKD